MSDQSTDYLKPPLARTTLLRRLGLAGVGALGMRPAIVVERGRNALSTPGAPAGSAELGSGLEPPDQDDVPAATPPYVGDVENLRYDDPFNQTVKPAWYDGKKIFHLDLGVTMTRPGYMTAEQYLIISAHAPLPTTVEGFNNAPIIGDVIYSAVPGQFSYSPTCIKLILPRMAQGGVDRC